MKLQSSLFAVRVVFVMLLSLAFACKDETKNANPPMDDGRTNTAKASTNSENSNALTEDALTEDVVKQVFTRQANDSVANYSGKEGGGSTSPKSVSVDFEGIQFGITRKANIKDENEGVPPGATMHPVRAKYTIVSHYADKDRENKYNEDYYFYKDKSGAWARLSMKAGAIK